MSRTSPRKAGDESAWTQKSFVAAVVGLAAVAVLALILVLDTPSKELPTEGGPPAPAGAVVEKQVVRRDSCRLPKGDLRVPSTAPRNTRWELVGTMVAPTAPDTLGPGRVEDGMRSCFARSPRGALYAAVNFWALGTAKPSALVIRRLAADSPERTKAIAQLGPREDAPAIRASMQIAGFRFLSYDSGKATIGIAMRVSSGRLASVPTTLRWEDGDWKYVIGPQGNPGITELRDLAGYVAWGGA